MKNEITNTKSEVMTAMGRLDIIPCSSPEMIRSMALERTFTEYKGYRPYRCVGFSAGRI